MTNTAPRTGYAPVNGIDFYYEIHGEGGQPLILSHGGLGTIEMIFADLLPRLAATRQVIAVELQAHGHTADGGREMTYEIMGDDIAALVAHLGLENADVLGFSLGGGAALQTAIRHPEKVRKLVLISTPFKRTGWYPEVLEGMATVNAQSAMYMLETPMYEAYARVAPKPEEWPVLAEKVGALLKRDYDWSADLARLPMPVQLIFGDSDSISPAHAAEMFALLGGGKADGFEKGKPESQLAILPHTHHIEINTRADLLTPLILPFLDL